MSLEILDTHRVTIIRKGQLNDFGNATSTTTINDFPCVIQNAVNIDKTKRIIKIFSYNLLQEHDLIIYEGKKYEITDIRKSSFEEETYYKGELK